MGIKISLDDNELKQHRAVTLRGALEGAAIGTGIVAPTFYLLNKRSNYYRSLPFTMKVLGGVVLVGPLVTIMAEKRSVEFERDRWTGIGKTEFEKRKHAELDRWASLSTKDKAAEWAAKHQLSVLMGSWGTTLAIAGSVIMRDPLLTMPQKVVQVRLWAQGLTIGVLIATAAFTNAQRAAVEEIRRHGDRSWEFMLEDERLEKRQTDT